MFSLITKTVNKKGCFDLQFRRDVKHNRANKPVYYSWKVQFIITGKYQDEDLLRKVKKTFNCGRLHFIDKNKIRYSVQKIDHLYSKVVPLLKKCQLLEKKKNDFELWAKAIEILFQNKRKKIKNWQKEDFVKLIEIQKKMQKYKTKKIKSQKWLSVAESILK